MTILPRRWYTLTGQVIYTDLLAPDEADTSRKILEYDGTSASSNEYLEKVHRLILEKYPTYVASTRVFSGPIGAFYRDLWYRRQLVEARERNKSTEGNRILKNIRTHPARIIHDAFLDTGASQAVFARRFGISTSMMSKLVRCFKVRDDEAKDEPVFSTATIIETLSQLSITPHGAYFDQPSPRARDFREIGLSPTNRELQLLLVLIRGMRAAKRGNVDGFVKDFAKLFNDSGIHFLDAVVKCLLAVLGVEEFATWPIENFIEDDLPSPSQRSERLLKAWEETFGVEVRQALARHTEHL